MRMDFDTAPMRRGTDSVKWDATADVFHMEPGDDILPLWVADMDFACAPEILEAIRGAYAPGALGYRTLSPKFAESVVYWMHTRHHLTVDPAWILPLPGVVAGISAAIAAFSEAGDEVIIQTPVYTPFYDVPRKMGRTLLENPLIEREEDGYLTYGIDLDQLRTLAARPRARVMVLCSPHNPIGRVHTREELAAIARICAENDVYLVSDEIHSDIMLDGAEFVPVLAAAPAGTKRICQLGSPSKSFNTAGTHAAYMIVPDEEERRKVSAVWDALHFPTESFTAAEVVAAAYGPAAYYADELCAYISENMRTLTEYLRRSLPGVRIAREQATYLLWVDLTHCGVPADRVMRVLLDRARVAPDPGEWFGDGCVGYVRLNVAMPRATILAAAERIVRAMQEETQLSAR